MLKYFFKIFLFLFLISFFNCAKRGSITGGLKDTLAPVLKLSFPKNFNTNFKGNEIKLTFDEFIKLKDLNKQLIISPPMKNEPLILPTSVGKYISITIKDTLQPNTTYSFNFGQSITDNNEGNPYNQFKYVFSTGNQIDTLKLTGTIKDAFAKEAESFVSVMLYEINKTFKDSVVYKETPRYITNTLDSLKTFSLENLKEGKYLLVAMKDYGNNNKFNPAKDKIAFHNQHITIPTTESYELKLFKEQLPLKVFRPYQASGNRLVLPCQGDVKDLKIMLQNNKLNVSTIITKFPKKDSLQVWFSPLKVDSLKLDASKNNYKANFTFKVKEQKKDTLNLKPSERNSVFFNDAFALETATPLKKIDNSKIKIVNKDSVAVDFSTKYDDFNQLLYFEFKKEPLENYTIKLLPNAVLDFLDQINKIKVFTTATKSFEDYGNLKISLQKVKRFPIIVELTNANGDVIATQYAEKNPKVEFNLIEPNVFSIRAIYDDNKNGVWDSGNYLEKRQAEEVIYLSKEVDVRSNWDIEQVFDLSIPYSPPPNKKSVKKKGSKSSMF